MNREQLDLVYGLVLAGGRSTRMGTDKAALIHPDGRTLARRTHDLLGSAGCHRVFLSLRQDQAVPPGLDDVPLNVVRDPAGANQGPMAGMLAAMHLHPAAGWLVVACDLPRLDVASVVNLLESRRDGEVLLSYRSEFDDLPEPLCAYYGAGALELLEQTVADGLRCPRKVLMRHGCRLLEPVSPRALDNANTPGDWETARLP